MNTWLVAGGAVRPSLGRVGGGAGLRGLGIRWDNPGGPCLLIFKDEKKCEGKGHSRLTEP